MRQVLLRRKLCYLMLSYFQLSKYPDNWQRDEFEFLKFHKFSKIFD